MILFPICIALPAKAETLHERTLSQHMRKVAVVKINKTKIHLNSFSQTSLNASLQKYFSHFTNWLDSLTSNQSHRTNANNPLSENTSEIGDSCAGLGNLRSKGNSRVRKRILYSFKNCCYGYKRCRHGCFSSSKTIYCW